MPSTAVPEYGIVDVWHHNLEEEFVNIRKIVQKYNYVAMVRFLRKGLKWLSNVLDVFLFLGDW